MSNITKKRLALFLGELRAGSDVETAACVSEIPIVDARRLDADEKRGMFRNTLGTPPPLSVDGNVLSIAMTGGRVATLHIDLPEQGEAATALARTRSPQG